MIQRIQSLYLLVALVLIVSMFFLPFSVFKLDGVISLINQPFDSSTPIVICKYALLLLAIVIVFLLLFAILSFKNRDKQMKLCKKNIALLLFLFVIEVLCILFLKSKITEAIRPTIISVFPLISAVLCYMALKSIKKDDDLVKSVDRLR
jgi:magnesium-transporting ATPase (P-type)